MAFPLLPLELLAARPTPARAQGQCHFQPGYQVTAQRSTRGTASKLLVVVAHPSAVGLPLLSPPLAAAGGRMDLGGAQRSPFSHRALCRGRAPLLRSAPIPLSSLSQLPKILARLSTAPTHFLPSPRPTLAAVHIPSLPRYTEVIFLTDIYFFTWVSTETAGDPLLGVPLLASTGRRAVSGPSVTPISHPHGKLNFFRKCSSSQRCYTEPGGKGQSSGCPGGQRPFALAAL